MVAVDITGSLGKKHKMSVSLSWMDRNGTVVAEGELLVVDDPLAALLDALNVSLEVFLIVYALRLKGKSGSSNG